MSRPTLNLTAREVVLCPYCDSPAVLVDSKEIYGGKSYGLVWLCRPCRAWCGVHKGSHRPLGTLANGTVRELRKKAHATFDPIWKSRLLTRKQAYQRLAEAMGIEYMLCHIGMMQKDECHRAIAAAKEIARELRGPT
jgi:hypothetical protein